MAWSEQYQIVQDQYRQKILKFQCIRLHATIFLITRSFMIVHPELKIKSYLLLADDIKLYVNHQLRMNDVVNHQLRMNDVISQRNIKQDQTTFLKVEL